MSHEQSETIQRPDGKWINVFGRDTPKAGQPLPNSGEFGTVDDAVAAARQRSTGMTQTATNPQTGETVVLIGNEWKRPEQTATNEKGEKAFLVGGNWIVGSGAASQNTASPAAPSGSLDVEEFRSQRPESEAVIDTLGQRALENAPEIGSIIGGVAGGLTPLPGGRLAGKALGTAIGSAVGTVAGTSIGTSIKQLKKQSKGNIPGASDVLSEQAGNVGEQLLWDVIGSTIGGAVVKGFNKLAPTAREGAAAAQDALVARGGSLSASQAAESPTMNLAESFARAGAGGKGRFITLDKRNADALQSIKDSLISSISQAPPSDRVAGKLFQDAIKRGDGAHSIAAKGLYEAFDSRVAGVSVDTSNVGALGKSIAESFERIGNIGKTDAGGTLISQLQNAPKSMSFSDAQSMRSNLVALIRDLKSSANPQTKAIRTAALALKAVEDSMETAAKRLSPDLFGEFRQINTFYKIGKNAFNNDVVADLLMKSPERVGEALFRSGNVSEIIQAKASLRQAAQFDKTLDAKEVLARLRSGYVNQLLTSKTALNIEGETTAQNLLKLLSEAKTNRQFQVLFTKQQNDAISGFGRTAFLTLRNKPSQFGILAPLLQAGAIGNLLTGGEYGGQAPLRDIGIIAAPAVLAAILTNPRAVSVLTRGLLLPTGTAVTGSIVAKLANEMRQAMSETPEGQ